MGFASNLLVVVVACLAFQSIVASPPFFVFGLRNVGYELSRTADEVESDLKEDILNIKDKVWREANRAIRRARGNRDINSCVVSAQQENLRTLDDLSVEGFACINSMRGEIPAIAEREYTGAEASRVRNDFKNRVKACRNRAKADFRTSQNDFARAARDCQYRRY